MPSSSSRTDITKLKIHLAVEALNQAESRSFKITAWPDETNRSSTDCDALATSTDGTRLAIEHTRIETFKNQAEDSQKLINYLEPIIPMIEQQLNCKIALAVPTFALPAGCNWTEIANAMLNYLLDTNMQLPWGESTHENIPGIPFKFCVDRNDARSGPARWAPPGDRVEGLREMIERALKKKVRQLSQYRQDGFKTMLILDSEDTGLVNQIHAYKAFLLASNFSTVEPYDYIWFFRLLNNEALYCLCFQGPEEVMKSANPSNFGIVPSKNEYWRKTIETEIKNHPD